MGKISVWVAVSLIILVSACDDSTTLVLEPNPAVRIEIDPARCPSVDQCSFCVLETDAFDKNANPAPLPTLIWSSANETIATVESRPGGEGRVNAWTVGITSMLPMRSRILRPADWPGSQMTSGTWSSSW